jgi:hypothetical protein
MNNKLKMQIDVTSEIQTYKVLMSEVIGYYINVTAESPEEAETYARLKNRDSMYKRYGDKVVETEFVEVVEALSKGDKDVPKPQKS